MEVCDSCGSILDQDGLGAERDASARQDLLHGDDPAAEIVLCGDGAWWVVEMHDEPTQPGDRSLAPATPPSVRVR